MGRLDLVISACQSALHSRHSPRLSCRQLGPASAGLSCLSLNKRKSRPPQLVASSSLIEIQYEQPNGRRQVGLLSLGIDFGDEGVQFDIARDGTLLEPIPELILKADACLATGNDDGMPTDRTLASFHCASHHAFRLTSCDRPWASQRKSPATWISGA